MTAAYAQEEMKGQVDRQSKMDNILERGEALNEHLENFRQRLEVIVGRLDGGRDEAKNPAPGNVPSPIAMTQKLHSSLDRRETIQDKIRELLNTLDEIV